MSNELFECIGLLMILVGLTLYYFNFKAHKQLLQRIPLEHKNLSSVKALTSNNSSINYFFITMVIIGIIIFTASVASPRFFLTQT
jgi:hypothetical protein